MKKFETGKEKIQKICEMLRRETLEPAEGEAGAIVVKAREEAARIIAEAEKQAAHLEELAKQRIEKERHVFQSSLEQGCRQSLESLRQSIEKQLFRDELGKEVATATADPKLIASIVNAMVAAIEKEGTAVNLAAVVPATVKPEDVSRLLLGRAKELLKDGVVVGTFKGGARIQLRDQSITIDLSDEALVELLGRYVRKDFRELLFKTGV